MPTSASDPWPECVSSGTVVFTREGVEVGQPVALYSCEDSATITVTDGDATGPVTVTVTNVDTLSGNLPNGFNFTGTQATVTSVNPTAGPIAGGTPATITGSNFAAGATVQFGAGTATTGAPSRSFATTPTRSARSSLVECSSCPRPDCQ